MQQDTKETLDETIRKILGLKPGQQPNPDDYYELNDEWNEAAQKWAKGERKPPRVPQGIKSYKGKHRVRKIHSDEEFEQIVKSTKDSKNLVILFFTAIWSEPCDIAREYYGELSIDYENVIFLEVDVDEMYEEFKKEHPDSANHPWYYKYVQHVPTWHFYKFQANCIIKEDEFGPLFVTLENRERLIGYMDRHGGIDSLKPYIS